MEVPTLYYVTRVFTGGNLVGLRYTAPQPFPFRPGTETDGLGSPYRVVSCNASKGKARCCVQRCGSLADFQMTDNADTSVCLFYCANHTKHKCVPGVTLDPIAGRISQ